MVDLFISYSRADEAFTKRLYRELQRFNVHGFMDAADVAMGSEWSTRLKETVRNADAVVVILSKSAVRSNYVMAEIGLAKSLDKPVLPVLAPAENYEESVPPLLLDRIVVDANSLELESVAAHIVAAVTNKPVELALNEVTSRARRHRRVLASVAFSFFGLLLVSLGLYFVARQQQMAAEIARKVADNALTRIQELTGNRGKFAITPDGNFVATGGRDRVRLWDTKTGNPVSTLDVEGAVGVLTFSGDGKLLAVAAWDGTVTIWEVPSALLLRRLSLASAVTAVQFSPDGRLLYSRSVDDTIRVWSLQDGRELRTFEAPS